MLPSEGTLPGKGEASIPHGLFMAVVSVNAFRQNLIDTDLFEVLRGRFQAALLRISRPEV